VALEQLAQGFATQQRHHQIGKSERRNGEIVDAHDARVVERGQQACLLQETARESLGIGTIAAAAQPRLQHLDRGLAQQRLVARAEHHAHAAAAQHPLDPVVAQRLPDQPALVAQFQCATAGHAAHGGRCFATTATRAQADIHAASVGEAGRAGAVLRGGATRRICRCRGVAGILGDSRSAHPPGPPS